MILIFSDLCPYCRTLLEEVKRRDVDKKVKLLSVDTLRAKGSPLITKIDSVPALMLLDPDGNGNHTFIFGKVVFDTLIAPRTGYLSGGGASVMGGGLQQGDGGGPTGGVQQQLGPGGGGGGGGGGGSSNENGSLPAAFDMTMSNGALTSSFASFSDQMTMDNQSLTGSGPIPTISGADSVPPGGMPRGQGQMGPQTNMFQEPAVVSAKGEKSLPDIDKLLMARSTDIQRFSNTNSLPPPQLSTR
jgi:hypothetical protein